MKLKSGKSRQAEKQKEAQKPRRVFTAAGQTKKDKSVLVTAKHWVHRSREIRSKKVKDVYKKLKDLWNLAPNQQVLVNSKEADMETVLHDGDVLEFVKKATQKGYRKT